MPSITTHHYFAQDVLKELPDNIKKTIKNEELIYSTFAQSHDYLFYYTFDIKNFRRIRELGHRAHHEHTKDYLINIVKEIKNNHLENNHQVIAYLYGSVTHYCLDSTCHPYIFYKTGIYRKNNPESKKYRGEHNHMEKDLDAIYYELNTHKKYNKCNISKDIIKKPIFNKELTNTITNVYKETYNEDNIGIYFNKSIKHSKIILSLAVNDSLGIKRAIYKFIDFITNHHFGYIQSFSTHILNPDLNYLNIEKKEWNHPSGKHVKYNSSFPELYEIALQKSLNMIKTLNDVIFNNKDIKILDKVIRDVDYSTGMLIKDNLRMDYFE
ncbi:MAG TPA: hypothetical protein DCE23_00505 [Firmicutes bacterium]|nr:hypothetical protein [Bacillota bacterium]